MFQRSLSIVGGTGNIPITVIECSKTQIKRSIMCTAGSRSDVATCQWDRVGEECEWGECNHAKKNEYDSDHLFSPLIGLHQAPIAQRVAKLLSVAMIHLPRIV